MSISINPFSSCCSFMFWFIATTFSLYQGIRALYVQNRKHFQDRHNPEVMNELWKGHFIIHYYIHDFLFNIICSMAGFIALHIEWYMFRNISKVSEIESGTGIIICFLSFVALAGISGVLPPILYHGRWKK